MFEDFQQFLEEGGIAALLLGGIWLFAMFRFAGLL
jgi:hypothetical protein